MSLREIEGGLVMVVTAACLVLPFALLLIGLGGRPRPGGEWLRPYLIAAGFGGLIGLFFFGVCESPVTSISHTVAEFLTKRGFGQEIFDFSVSHALCGFILAGVGAGAGMCRWFTGGKKV